MFQDFPGCSGMFHVPAFINDPQYLLSPKKKNTKKIFQIGVKFNITLSLIFNIKRAIRRILFHLKIFIIFNYLNWIIYDFSFDILSVMSRVYFFLILSPLPRPKVSLVFINISLSSFKLNQLLYKLHHISFINFTLGIGSLKWTGSPFFLVTIIVMNTILYCYK